MRLKQTQWSHKINSKRTRWAEEKLMSASSFNHVNCHSTSSPLSLSSNSTVFKIKHFQYKIHVTSYCLKIMKGKSKLDSSICKIYGQKKFPNHIILLATLRILHTNLRQDGNQYTSGTTYSQGHYVCPNCYENRQREEKLQFRKEIKKPWEVITSICQL